MRLRRRSGGEAGDGGAEAEPTETAPVPRARSRRLSALLNRLPPPPRSTRGLIVLVVLVGGIGAASTLGGIAMLHYTETAGFCGRCHTMGPELKAYAMSPHREVPCAECHVSPGIGGWIKAKINGTKQVLEIATGTFPEPIPPPDHADLPSVKDTCMKCHSLDEITEDGGPVKLVLRPRYKDDRANTKEMIAIVLRPAGLGRASGVRGVHWHVQQKVEFTRSDEQSQKIDWVGVTFENGTSKQFIAGSEVNLSNDVEPDITRLKKIETTRRMDCIECHNRIGHEIPSVSRLVDDAIAAGKIGADLPYIKRDALALLNASYRSTAAADKAIAGIRRAYAARYPLVLRMRGKEVTEAVVELQQIYRLVATPEMRVTAKTYANNLGHQSSPGCFRCHDGAHYRVVNGRLTSETIPWACATCHTFPQAGSSVSNVLFYGEPGKHEDKLWVFNHKSRVASLDPAGTSCGACHTRSYCENCHTSGAAKVTHDEMLYNHASAIRKSGVEACAYCHQPVSCMKCHKGNPLGKDAAPHTFREPNTLRVRD